MNAKDLKIAEHLAVEGVQMSSALRDDNRWYFENLKNSYFSIAAAISLTWTKHAKYEADFITYAASYIDSQTLRNQSIVKKFSFRFGFEPLDKTLISYRNYYENVRDAMVDFSTCDIHALKRLQHKLLSRLDSLRISRKVTGIGPWLFTGPFKIILGDQERLWNQDGINAIVLPTGLEVDRGINRLIKERYSFMKDFDSHWLLEDSNSLLDSYATYSMAHTFIANIGHITNTPAIHINSALYLYGKDEI